jgi:hypothetical protein
VLPSSERRTAVRRTTPQDSDRAHVLGELFFHQSASDRNADQFKGVSTVLITSFQTFTTVQTITSPIQTLFSTTCSPQDQPKPKPPTITTTTTAPGEQNTVIIQPDTPTPTPTPAPVTTSSTSSTSVYVAPVTRTSTFTSTDLSGNVFVSAIETVITPTPEPTQSASGTNIPVVVGSVVGGLVGVVALIGIIWYIMHRKAAGRWDDIWEEDEGHQAGAAEVKQARPAAAGDGSSLNPYVYGAVGRGTPSPLLRGDQASGVHSHSRSVSSATGYADHARSNSQTPLMFSTSPPHSPPNSPPSLRPPQLPGAGVARTPIWANPSAQQGYFQQPYPPIPSDPNFMPTTTSTYSTASSTQGLLNGYVSPTHTAANPAVAYPPGAAPPIMGGRRSTYNEYHKPPLEQPRHEAARPPSQRSATNFVDPSTDNSEYSVATGFSSVHTLSIRDQKSDKGGLSIVNGPPTSPTPTDPSRRTSLLSVAPKTPHPAPILEDAPPAYN